MNTPDCQSITQPRLVHTIWLTVGTESTPATSATARFLFSASGQCSLTPSATAWLASSPAGQYHLSFLLLPGFCFPPPGSTTHAFRYCLPCFFRHRAVLPAASATAWLAFPALGQYSSLPSLLPGLLFPPPGSTTCRLRYCLACFFRFRAVLPTPSATAWPAFSATGQYYPRLPLLPGLLFPPPGSTTCRLRYCLACFSRHRAVLLAPFPTAWLAFPALGQYSSQLSILPGLFFPPLGNTLSSKAANSSIKFYHFKNNSIFLRICETFRGFSGVSIDITNESPIKIPFLSYSSSFA